MYCWGDDTSDWARPQAYRFAGSQTARAARRAAAQASRQRGGRRYLSRSAPELARVDPFGKKIATRSANPVVVAVDVTGSMSHWPYEIFDRLPLLYQTLAQYRPDVEISFVAIGDATSDRYPLQICDFARGIALEDELNAIYGEGGGGGTLRESYELFAYYLLHHARAPEASERPFLILYGDEAFYERVAAAHVRSLIGDDLQEDVDSRRVFAALCESWQLYLLRKPYGGGRDDAIEEQWLETIGPGRLVRLESAERAVDMALGIIARAWGRAEDFARNLSARQSDAVVRRLEDALDEVLQR
ncbi:MAG: hypothetical protein D6731_06160 [Planctomycetota bacterium]|nr:MAG: hypothetical protein D6731_06160 [Planctomycetota bacterium]